MNVSPQPTSRAREADGRGARADRPRTEQAYHEGDGFSQEEAEYRHSAIATHGRKLCEPNAVMVGLVPAIHAVKLFPSVSKRLRARGSSFSETAA
jgi:hypothetical protein